MAQPTHSTNHQCLCFYLIFGLTRPPIDPALRLKRTIVEDRFKMVMSQDQLLTQSPGIAELCVTARRVLQDHVMEFRYRSMGKVTNETEHTCASYMDACEQMIALVLCPRPSPTKTNQTIIFQQSLGSNGQVPIRLAPKSMHSLPALLALRVLQTIQPEAIIENLAPQQTVSELSTDSTHRPMVNQQSQQTQWTQQTLCTQLALPTRALIKTHQSLPSQVLVPRFQQTAEGIPTIRVKAETGVLKTATQKSFITNHHVPSTRTVVSRTNSPSTFDVATNHIHKQCSYDNPLAQGINHKGSLYAAKNIRNSPQHFDPPLKYQRIQ